MTTARLAAQDGGWELRRRDAGHITQVLRAGKWTIFSPVILNNSDQPGPVKVVFPTMANGRSIEFFREISVPSGWRRALNVSFRPGQLTETDEAIGGRIQTPVEHLIRDVNTGEVLVRMTINTGMVPVDAGERAKVICISATPGVSTQHVYNDTKYLRELPDKELGEFRDLKPYLTNFPPHFYGLDAIDILILSGTKYTRLRPSQFQAISDWVRRGGLLVLTGSEELPDMLSGPLGDMTGVAAGEVQMVNRITVTKEDGQPLEAVDLPMAMPLVELCPESAEVLREVNGLPLVTRNQCGSGTVMVFSVPSLALEDASLHPVWNHVTRGLYLRPAVSGGRFMGVGGDGAGRAAGHEALLQIAGRPAPAPGLPLGILLALAGLVFAGGLMLRRFRRGEVIWLALVPLALAGSATAWYLGTQTIETERLTTLSFVLGVEGGRARIQETCALYSGPKERTLDFRADEPDATVELVGGGGGMELTEIGSGASLFLSDYSIPLNTTQSFHIDAVVPLDGVTGSLSFSEQGMVGELTNRLGARLEKGVLYYNRRTFRLGDLPIDQATNVVVGGDALPSLVQWQRERGKTPRALGEFTASDLNLPSDTLRNDLVGRLVTVPRTTVDVGNRPFLIGYVNRSFLRPLGGAKIPRQGWSVVAWPLAFRRAPAGTSMFVPFGITNVHIEHKASVYIWHTSDEAFIPSNRSATIWIRVSPPAGEILDDVSAVIRTQLERARGLSLEVSGVTPAGRTVPLTTIARPEIEQIPIENADRFRNAEGEFVFQLRVEDLEGGALATDEPIDWQFRLIEASLKGTSK